MHNPRHPNNGINRYKIYRRADWTLSFIDKTTGKLYLRTNAGNLHGFVPLRIKVPGIPDEVTIHHWEQRGIQGGPWGTLLAAVTDNGDFVFKQTNEDVETDYVQP